MAFEGDTELVRLNLLLLSPSLLLTCLCPPFQETDNAHQTLSSPNDLEILSKVQVLYSTHRLTFFQS
jgi:hypothetical protein